MAAIARWQLDPVSLANVKTGLIVDHDDVGSKACRMTGIDERCLERLGSDRVSFQEAMLDPGTSARNRSAPQDRQACRPALAPEKCGTDRAATAHTSAGSSQDLPGSPTTAGLGKSQTGTSSYRG